MVRDADRFRWYSWRMGIKVSLVAVKDLVKRVFLFFVVSKGNFMENCRTMVVDNVVVCDGSGVGTMAIESEFHR